ncbi:UPAR/Ly6 domain-containing protein crim [Macrobrachium rosenbergii]|uniref:UPAR/Ly6 domain-containing protein crim n=1 Tax=Macrobrachium rosenbergii TaxID=79674 RepID=UPI0034D67DB0
MKSLAVFLVFAGLLKTGLSLWCYRCVGSHPGCGMYDFDWRYYWSYNCPDPGDKCVKVIEQKGAELMVIRDCLSYLEGHRRDIPADRYEGCRPAAADPQLGHYIFPSVDEIDHRRKHYKNITFCFCDFDERCNSASTSTVSVAFLLLSVGVLFFSVCSY